MLFYLYITLASMTAVTHNYVSPNKRRFYSILSNQLINHWINQSIVRSVSE